MGREKLTLVFQRNGEVFRHKWVIKKGVRGSRDANKVRKLQEKWGDPIEIVGNGSVANLLRREYKIYNKDKLNYKGVSTKNILKVGAEVSDVPVRRLSKISHKIFKKLKRN